MPSDAPVLIIACGALAREIVALKKINGWSAMDVQCLPPELHNRPERIPAAVREAIAAGRERYSRIFVAYADCGTGGLLDAVLQSRRHRAPARRPLLRILRDVARVRGTERGRARHVLPDRFPGPALPAARHRRARHRSPPRARQRVLPAITAALVYLVAVEGSATAHDGARHRAAVRARLRATVHGLWRSRNEPRGRECAIVERQRRDPAWHS